ncbi:MAG: complex I subunit 4 family protein, partial [Candidatus Promineifilaceae bacterium]
MEGNGLLSLMTFFPSLGAVAILLLRPLKRESDDRIRQIAIGASAVTFLVSLWVLARFEPRAVGLQLIERLNWIPSLGITYFLGLDGVSILFVLLTTFVSLLSIISSWSAIQHQIKQYYVFMLLLETGLVGVFLAQDLFLFYIFWEFTLVPMYFLIGIWGGERRVYASIKFFLYTMAGSLLMLLAILYLGLSNDTFALPELIAGRAAFAAASLQRLLFLGFAIAFAIKVPIWPFHSWLPDAHTEAPTAGSIILAGILLKMGTYGFIRFNLPLFPEASRYFAPLIAVLAIIGIIYG